MRDSGRLRLSRNLTMTKKMAAVAVAPAAATSSGAAKTSWSRALLSVSKSSAGLATKKVSPLRTWRALSPRMPLRPTNMPTRMMDQTTKKPARTPSIRRSLGARLCRGRCPPSQPNHIYSATEGLVAGISLCGQSASPRALRVLRAVSAQGGVVQRERRAHETGSEAFGGVVAKLDDTVVLVHVDHLRLVGLGFLGGHLRVGDEDDDVVFVHQMCRRAVDPDYARTAFTGDGVRFEAGAVCDIHNGYELAGQNIGSIQQVQVHGDGTHVVQVRVRDSGAVDFGLEHCAIHNGNSLTPGSTIWL